MDFSKFKPSDWLKTGGGLVMLIAYFLDWTSFDCGAGGLSSAACDDANLSGSSFFFRGTLPWILIVAVAVISTLLALDVMKRGTVPWALIFLAASALGTLLVLIYVINPTYSGVDVGRGIGSILALLAAAAVLVGSIMGFKESGGSLNDLKDMNRLKGQFGGGGTGNAPSAQGMSPPSPPSSGTPPPPPSSSTPPPPPPPQT